VSNAQGKKKRSASPVMTHVLLLLKNFEKKRFGIRRKFPLPIRGGGKKKDKKNLR